MQSLNAQSPARFSVSDKRHLYATAFHAELVCFCSLHEYRESDDTYLCNFGHANVRIDATELSRFCL